MPQRCKRPCLHPGCSALVTEGYCDKHKQDKQSHDKYRGNSSERGYGGQWQKYRLYYLQLHPLCIDCLKNGKVTAATVVDHIKPHKSNKVLFWDTTNHQSLCAHHHNIKSSTEDGGWGNKK